MQTMKSLIKEIAGWYGVGDELYVIQEVQNETNEKDGRQECGFD